MSRFVTLVAGFFLLTCPVLAQISDPVLPAGEPAVFHGLGFLFEGPFGTYSQAHGVSADGSVVVGMSTSSHGGFSVEAFRWENGEMAGLGTLPSPFGVFSQARSVSADGSTVVGYGFSENTFPERWEAIRWTQDDGIEGLGDFSLPYWSEATGASADGSVIVGRSSLSQQAFRWENGEMQMLSGEDAQFVAAWGVSPDGSVIVGQGIIEGVQQACLWSESSGVIGLGAPLGEFATAYSVSADGTVVVGVQLISQADYEAFIWTEEKGMVGLGYLSSSASHSEAMDISADGSVVVGASLTDINFEAFIWTESEGMRNLKEVLENDYGLDLTGWTLNYASAVSADGRVIVGTGVNPDGNDEAWRAVLPPLGETGPENDHIANATFIPSANTTLAGTNVNATLEDGEPEPSCTFEDWTTNFSVWWLFIAEVDVNRVTIDTFGSDFDTILSLHRMGNLEEIACDDDTQGLQSQIVDAPIEPGHIYLIRVAGYNESSINQGTIQLTTALHWVSGEPESETFVTSLTAPSPNPVRGTAAFSLTVDREQNVTVAAFDVMGRRVQTLYEGTPATGEETTLRLDASSLSSGMYIIRAVGEDFLLTQRVTVIQ